MPITRLASKQCRKKDCTEVPEISNGKQTEFCSDHRIVCNRCDCTIDTSIKDDYGVMDGRFYCYECMEDLNFE